MVFAQLDSQVDHKGYSSEPDMHRSGLLHDYTVCLVQTLGPIGCTTRDGDGRVCAAGIGDRKMTIRRPWHCRRHKSRRYRSARLAAQLVVRFPPIPTRPSVGPSRRHLFSRNRT